MLNMSKVTQSLPFITFASGIGMFLEVFDFLVYGYLATIIAEIFFPPMVPAAALLSALAVFGVGYLMRPVGSLVFGHISDKYGRKVAFAFTLIIMGIATIGIGLSPTYEAVGILATIILIIFRLLQGFSLGGEFGSATTYMLEHAPSHRRALYASIVQGMWPLGILAAVVTLYLVSALSKEAMLSWGWRIPFLVAGVIAIVGLIARLMLEETPVFKEIERRGLVAKSPIVEAFKKAWLPFLIVLLLQVAETSIWYSSFLTTFIYWQVVSKVPYATALFSYIILMIITFFTYILGGYLTDVYGRRPIFRYTYSIAALTVIPLFYVFNVTSNPLFLGITTYILLIYAAFGNADLGAAFPELMPADVRVTGFGFAYQIATGIYGGFIPYISTALLLTFHNPALSVLYVAIGLAIGAIVAWLWLPETKGVDLTRVKG